DRLGFPVFPIDWKDAVTGEMSSGYREKGYFKEAFVNMLAFLGWNPGTEKELYTMDELIQDFSLERVGKSGAKFDAAKTNWYNQQFLREQSNEVLAVALKPYLDAESLTYTDSQLPTFIELMKERASFVSEMLEGRYMFEKPSEYDEKTVSKKWKENSGAILTDLASQFEQTVDFGSENLHEVFKSHLEAKEIGMGAVLPVLRVVVTGKGAGPSIFDIMAFLGKEESVDRIKEGVQKLG
ncbi:MAG: glutamate--tRNA ligase family protein, partial [Salibacteraceae bacterium]|nr:glutamate--tRNA ligase family protein [Salibacteraceae bacterium]